MRELEVADMLQGLRSKPDASADLILAADAMVYVADLAARAGGGQARAGDRAACWRSRPKPMTARASSSARGCATRTARTYVRAAVAAAGLKLSQLENRSARNEDNAPVPGLVVVATKA